MKNKVLAVFICIFSIAFMILSLYLFNEKLEHIRQGILENITLDKVTSSQQKIVELFPSIKGKMNFYFVIAVVFSFILGIVVEKTKKNNKTK